MVQQLIGPIGATVLLVTKQDVQNVAHAAVTASCCCAGSGPWALRTYESSPSQSRWRARWLAQGQRQSRRRETSPTSCQERS